MYPLIFPIKLEELMMVMMTTMIKVKMITTNDLYDDGHYHMQKQGMGKGSSVATIGKFCTY